MQHDSLQTLPLQLNNENTPVIFLGHADLNCNPDNQVYELKLKYPAFFRGIHIVPDKHQLGHPFNITGKTRPDRYMRPFRLSIFARNCITKKIHLTNEYMIHGGDPWMQLTCDFPADYLALSGDFDSLTFILHGDPVENTNLQTISTTLKLPVPFDTDSFGTNFTKINTFKNLHLINRFNKAQSECIQNINLEDINQFIDELPKPTKSLKELDQRYSLYYDTTEVSLATAAKLVETIFSFDSNALSNSPDHWQDWSEATLTFNLALESCWMDAVSYHPLESTDNVNHSTLLNNSIVKKDNIMNAIGMEATTVLSNILISQLERFVANSTLFDWISHLKMLSHPQSLPSNATTPDASDASQSWVHYYLQYGHGVFHACNLLLVNQMTSREFYDGGGVSMLIQLLQQQLSTQSNNPMGQLPPELCHHLLQCLHVSLFHYDYAIKLVDSDGNGDGHHRPTVYQCLLKMLSQLAADSSLVAPISHLINWFALIESSRDLGSYSFVLLDGIAKISEAIVSKHSKLNSEPFSMVPKEYEFILSDVNGINEEMDPHLNGTEREMDEERRQFYESIRLLQSLYHGSIARMTSFIYALHVSTPFPSHSPTSDKDLPSDWESFTADDLERWYYERTQAPKNGHHPSHDIIIGSSFASGLLQLIHKSGVISFIVSLYSLLKIANESMISIDWNTYNPSNEKTTSISTADVIQMQDNLAVIMNHLFETVALRVPRWELLMIANPKVADILWEYSSKNHISTMRRMDTLTKLDHQLRQFKGLGPINDLCINSYSPLSDTISQSIQTSSTGSSFQFDINELIQAGKAFQCLCFLSLHGPEGVSVQVSRQYVISFIHRFYLNDLLLLIESIGALQSSYPNESNQKLLDCLDKYKVIEGAVIMLERFVIENVTHFIVQSSQPVRTVAEASMEHTHRRILSLSPNLITIQSAAPHESRFQRKCSQVLEILQSIQSAITSHHDHQSMSEDQLIYAIEVEFNGLNQNLTTFASLGMMDHLVQITNIVAQLCDITRPIVAIAKWIEYLNYLIHICGNAVFQTIDLINNSVDQMSSSILHDRERVLENMVLIFPMVIKWMEEVACSLQDRKELKKRIKWIAPTQLAVMDVLKNIFLYVHSHWIPSHQPGKQMEDMEQICEESVSVLKRIVMPRLNTDPSLRESIEWFPHSISFATDCPSHQLSAMMELFLLLLPSNQMELIQSVVFPTSHSQPMTWPYDYPVLTTTEDGGDGGLDQIIKQGNSIFEEKVSNQWNLNIDINISPFLLRCTWTDSIHVQRKLIQFISRGAAIHPSIGKQFIRSILDEIQQLTLKYISYPCIEGALPMETSSEQSTQRIACPILKVHQHFFYLLMTIDELCSINENICLQLIHEGFLPYLFASLHTAISDAPTSDEWVRFKGFILISMQCCESIYKTMHRVLHRYSSAPHPVAFAHSIGRIIDSLGSALASLLPTILVRLHQDSTQVSALSNLNNRIIQQTILVVQYLPTRQRNLPSPLGSLEQFFQHLSTVGHGMTIEFIAVKLWTEFEESFQLLIETTDIMKTLLEHSEQFLTGNEINATESLELMTRLISEHHSQFMISISALRSLVDVLSMAYYHGCITLSTLSKAMRLNLTDPKKIIIRFQRVYTMWATTLLSLKDGSNKSKTRRDGKMKDENNEMHGKAYFNMNRSLDQFNEFIKQSSSDEIGEETKDQLDSNSLQNKLTAEFHKLIFKQDENNKFASRHVLIFQAFKSLLDNVAKVNKIVSLREEKCTKIIPSPPYDATYKPTSKLMDGYLLKDPFHLLTNALDSKHDDSFMEMWFKMTSFDERMGSTVSLNRWHSSYDIFHIEIRQPFLQSIFGEVGKDTSHVSTVNDLVQVPLDAIHNMALDYETDVLFLTKKRDVDQDTNTMDISNGHAVSKVEVHSKPDDGKAVAKRSRFSSKNANEALAFIPPPPPPPPFLMKAMAQSARLQSGDGYSTLSNHHHVRPY